jgi:hypothetical protein
LFYNKKADLEPYIYFMDEIEKIKLPFNEWEILPIEVYEKGLAEVKEHFNDLSSEVESTTEKSIKTFIAFATFISASGLYILAKETFSVFTSILALLSAVNLIGLFLIIKAREHYLKGANIENMFGLEFDKEEYTADDKIRIFYCNCLENYATKIGLMKTIVSKRNYYYNLLLSLSLFLLIVISWYIGTIL